MPKHPLDYTVMFEGPNIVDIETHRSKDHFIMHPCNSRYHGMSRFENGLSPGNRFLKIRLFMSLSQMHVIPGPILLFPCGISP